MRGTVAIKRTQQDPGLKFSHKSLGPYEVIRVLRNHRYIVRKVDEHKGPLRTSLATDCMKLWMDEDDIDDISEDENEKEKNE